MSEREDDALSALGQPAGPLPPPSAALRQAVDTMRPVRTRSPRIRFVVVVVASLAFVSHAFVWHRLRPDLSALLLWVLATSLVWLGGFAFALGAALLPRRGQVLPDPGRASHVAFGVVGLVLALTLAANETVAGQTLELSGARAFFGEGVHCLVFEVIMTLVPLTAGLLALRGVLKTGSARIGAAIGAAGGALGGAALQTLCPYGDRLHVAVMHCGGVVVCALLGAVVARLVFRAA
jgi:hypothetical protein